MERLLLAANVFWYFVLSCTIAVVVYSANKNGAVETAEMAETAENIKLAVGCLALQ